MSAQVPLRRLTAPAFQARKGGTPLVCLTAYTAPLAKIYDPHVDMLLVGDSLGMVIYGFDSTLPVTLDMMIAHGAAVVRGTQKALIVIDMPFGTYEESPAQAFHHAKRLLAETGCGAVKLEGGEAMAETIAFLSQRGIPVMAHVGLTPQAVNALGGYGLQGGTEEGAAKITRDAEAVAAAGAFSVVIEKTAEPLARALTERLPIPVIGIGASPACDGQVLVTDDMLGVNSGFKPKFVKAYANLEEVIGQAVACYAQEVQQRLFPGPAHCFSGKK